MTSGTDRFQRTAEDGKAAAVPKALPCEQPE